MHSETPGDFIHSCHRRNQIDQENALKKRVHLNVLDVHIDNGATRCPGRSEANWTVGQLDMGSSLTESWVWHRTRDPTSQPAVPGIKFLTRLQTLLCRLQNFQNVDAVCAGFPHLSYESASRKSEKRRRRARKSEVTVERGWPKTARRLAGREWRLEDCRAANPSRSKFSRRSAVLVSAEDSVRSN